MKIYFSASIYGGRELINDYQKLILALKNYGEVLTEEIGDPHLIENEREISDEKIYTNDINKIKQADVIFAELTNPSLGVGYELGYAEAQNKKIIGIYNQTIKEKITPMIMGNKRINIVAYREIEEIIKKLKSLLDD